MSVVFEWIGFILAYALSQSHAAKCGSWVGLGVTMALSSVTVDDLLKGSRFWQQHSDATSAVGFVLAFAGYILILFGFFFYHRVRRMATDRISTVATGVGIQ